MTDTIGRGPGVLWRRTVEGVVLLAPGAQDPVLLAGTGAALWDVLGEPASVDELAATLASAFAVPAADVRADIGPVLDELIRDGFAVVTP